MSSALYRKYRPDTFDEVIGQEHVTEPLKRALDSGRITHAYLFSGPRGCGKTTSARIMARCLNCAKGPSSHPCGECDSCTELATGGPGSLDVVEIDAASHNGVDAARDLRERAGFAPVRDRYKIYILDEAHMVTSAGFNALLKIVEEPPEHVKFIFATTEPDKVIGTIRSRTHHYPFHLVGADVLLPYLSELCQRENIGVDDGVLPLAVRAGGGSVRDTLSVLDQLMAGAENAQISYDRAVALLGYTDSAILDSAVDAISGRDSAALFKVVEDMVDSGHDPHRFTEDLLQRLRDVLLVSMTGEDAARVLHHLPDKQLERMRRQAQVLGSVRASRAADLVAKALDTMTGATAPRLQVELLCARLLLPDPVAGALKADTQTIPEQSTASPVPPRAAASPQTGINQPRPADSPVQSPVKSATSQPEKNEPALQQSASDQREVTDPQKPVSSPGGMLPSQLIRDRWDDVLAALRRISPSVWSRVRGAQVGAVNDGDITMVFPSQHLASGFLARDGADTLANAIATALGLQMRVNAVSADNRHPADGSDSLANRPGSAAPSPHGSVRPTRRGGLSVIEGGAAENETENTGSSVPASMPSTAPLPAVSADVTGSAATPASPAAPVPAAAPTSPEPSLPSEVPEANTDAVDFDAVESINDPDAGDQSADAAEAVIAVLGGSVIDEYPSES